MNLQEIKSENNRIREFFAFVLTLITTLHIGLLLSLVPDKLDSDFILLHYVLALGMFHPETSEKLQYIICTFSFPLLYIFFSLIMKRIDFDCHSKVSSKLYAFGLFYGAAVIIFINWKQRSFLAAFQIFKSLPLDLAFIFLIGCIGVISIYKYESISKSTLRLKIINNLLLICGLAVVGYTSWLHITKTYLFGSGFLTWHFDAYFYPIYKVYSGQTPLIDFNCLYGFYPYLIVPILNLLGGVTMMRFSIIVSMLVAICFMSLFITLYRICRNKIIVFFGITAIIYWMVAYPMVFLESPYYLQYVPHRLLFPALLLALCSLQVTIKNAKLNKWLRCITFAVISIAILWNLDTGLVVAIAYPAFLIYNELTVYKLNEKILYRKASLILCESIISALGSYIFLLIITYVRSGEIFKFADMFYGQAAFYKYGFFMLRMPLVHNWILLIGVYIFALTKAMKNMAFLKSGEEPHNIPLNSMYFLISILGLGLFSYYQGRSHDNVFVSVCWPAFIILALFAQEYLDKMYKNIKKMDWQNIIKLVTIVILLASLTGMFIENTLDNTKMTQAKDKHLNMQKSDIDNALHVIDVFRKNNEPLNLIMYNAAEIYCTLNEKWTETVPASIDWYEVSDLNRVLDSIKKANSLVIFDNASFTGLWICNKIEVWTILNNNYQTGKLLNGYHVFIPKSFGKQTTYGSPSEKIDDIQLGSVGNNFSTALIQGGLYGDNWLGKMGSMLMASGNEGFLSMTCSVTQYTPQNQMHIYVNDVLAETVDLKAGDAPIILKVKVPKNEFVKITLTAEHTFCPAELGTGPDLRPLSVMLGDVVCS